MKYWAKLLNDNKLIKDVVVDFCKIENLENFETLMQKVSEELDVEMPICLMSDFLKFFEFKLVKFNSTYFIDTIDFDYMTLELLRFTKKEKTND